MPKTKQKSGAGRREKMQERPIHPYSRKALKLGKQLVHNKKVEVARSNQAMRTEILAEKLRWFQSHLDDRQVYTQEDTVDLVLQYRDRFSEELEQINIIYSVGNRKGQSRQHAPRESAIKMTMEEETNQFESSGIEIPDILNKKHLEEFRKWGGEVKFIQNLKLRKISRRHQDKLEQQNETEEELESDNDEVSCCEDSEVL